MKRILFCLAATGLLIWTPRGTAGPPSPLEIDAHRSEIWSIAFSPDGKQLASASKDRSIKLWDAGTGAAIGSLEGHGSDVLRIAWSPDGKYLVSGGGDGTIRIWDVEQRK